MRKEIIVGNINDMTVLELTARLEDVDRLLANTESPYLRKDLIKYRRRVKARLNFCLHTGKNGKGV
ncbi:MAG: hypothetical protein ACI4HJ_04960 [Ruminococcus sp.]